MSLAWSWGWHWNQGTNAHLLHESNQSTSLCFEIKIFSIETLQRTVLDIGNKTVCRILLSSSVLLKSPLPSAILWQSTTCWCFIDRNTPRVTCDDYAQLGAWKAGFLSHVPCAKCRHLSSGYQDQMVIIQRLILCYLECHLGCCNCYIIVLPQQSSQTTICWKSGKTDSLLA